MLFHLLIVGHKVMTMRQTCQANTYNGAQAIIKEQYPTAMFSPCGCYTPNLCGNNAAECISEASTYFGTIQTICI